jgi:septal ring factor EnvC (AmiA/AmiB activator)
MKYQFKRHILQTSLVGMIVSSMLLLSAVPVQGSVTAAREKKVNITQNIEKFDSEYKKYSGEAENYKTQTFDLQKQLDQIDAEVAGVERLITDIELVIAQLEEEDRELKVQVAELEQQMVDLLRNYQRASKITPLEVLLTSGNFTEGFNNLKSYSNIEERAQSVQAELDEKQVEIETNKQNNIKSRDSLEATRTIANNKKREKEIILERTKGSQLEFEALAKDYAGKIQELEAAADAAQQEYEAEVAKERAAEEARQRAAEAAAAEARRKSTGKSNPDLGGGGSGPSRPVSGGAGCWFDEQEPLSVPSGYFGRPSTGRITQGYGCSHDALDIASGYNSPLFAIANGVVVDRKSISTGYGNYVVVKHVLPSGQRVYALYGHMASASPLNVGTTVSRGDTVGYMGCSGYTLPAPCGIHTHFMIISQSYEVGGGGCRWNGSKKSKCYNPAKFINM